MFHHLSVFQVVENPHLIVVSLLSHGLPCCLDDLSEVPPTGWGPPDLSWSMTPSKYIYSHIMRDDYYSCLMFTHFSQTNRVPILSDFGNTFISRQETTGNLWHATEVHRGVFFWLRKL